MSNKKFKVKVIQLALRNNKLAKSGDVVSESQLTGNSEDLVKGKYIEPVNAKNTSDDDEKAAKEIFDKAYSEGELTTEQLDSLTKNEIYEYAEKHSYKYDSEAKKDALIEGVVKAEKVE